MEMDKEFSKIKPLFICSKADKKILLTLEIPKLKWMRANKVISSATTDYVVGIPMYLPSFTTGTSKESFC